MSTDTTLLPVGFIGLGQMGRPMALNLLKAGYPLTVYNRTAEKTADFAAQGAACSASPAGAVRNAAFVFICLPTQAEVEPVLFGPNGVLAVAQPGLVVIDCSTIAAGAARDFAARLKIAGVEFVDCPVSGGVKGAEAGTLSGMIGGDEAVVRRCLPVLQAVGKKFVHGGPVGSGQTLKACNQLVVAATLLGVSEAVALCRQSGLDPENMRQALTGGAAESFVLQNHAKRLIARTLAPGFRAKLMLKDLKIASALAAETGTVSPVTSLAVQQFTTLCENGHADDDSAAVGLVWQELAGRK